LDFSDFFLIWNIISSFGSVLSFFSILFFMVIVMDTVFSWRVLVLDIFNNSSLGVLVSNFSHINLENLLFFFTFYYILLLKFV
jgi:hypothetical protein